MAKDIAIIDFDNAKAKQMALAFVKNLRGPHWFDCRKVRGNRSLAQNAYLWGVVYPRIAAAMEEAWGESTDSDAAHEFLKDRFLRRPVIDRSTGECKGYIRLSSASLDKAEFAEYLDNVIKFAGEDLGIEIPAPNERETVTA